MLQEQQGRRVQENVAFALAQVLQLRKRIAAGQQPFLLQRTQPLRIPPRLQHERRRQIVEPFRLEQDALFALRGPQAFHVAVVLQVAHGGQHLGVGEAPAGIGGLQAAAEFFGRDDALAVRLRPFQAEHVVLDPLERRGRDRGGLVLPRDHGLHLLDQFGDAHAGQGARLDRAHDAVLPAERLQLLRRQRAAPAIRLGGHEDDGAAASAGLELFEPEAHPVQRVVDVGGIEQHQRQVGVIHEQRVDEPVIGLAREVPENRFALGAVGPALAQGGEHPELLAVRRSLLLELAVDHAIAQRRLAHAVIAHQHDLAGGVMHSLRRTVAQQHGQIQLPEMNQPAALILRRVWRRAGRGQQGQSGMKGKRGNPQYATRWLRDDGDGLPGIATPQPHRAIVALGRQQLAVGRKGDAINSARVPFQRAEQLAAGRLPQLHRVVTAPAGQRLARGVKRHAINRGPVPFEGAEQLAAGRLPQLHRVVLAPAGQRLARGVKRHAINRALCPSRVRSSLPLAGSHSFTVLSSLPLASVWPVGSNATL